VEDYDDRLDGFLDWLRKKTDDFLASEIRIAPKCGWSRLTLLGQTRAIGPPEPEEGPKKEMEFIEKMSTNPSTMSEEVGRILQETF